jgi:hypothetical protein
MYTITFRSIVGALSLASLGYAALIFPQSVVDLENSANLIVVGSITGAFRTGPVQSFSLQVSRVIKGDPSLAGSVIAVNWNQISPSMPLGTSMTASGTGLWFLQGSSSGWVLLPVVQGSAPLSMAFFPSSGGQVPSLYSYNSTALVADKLGSELSFAIENANGSYNYQLYSLLYGLLDELHSPTTSVLYQRMSVSLSIQQQILGLSGLIRSGSTSALHSAIQAASTFSAYPMETGILLQSIREYFRTADAQSITTLGQSATGLTNLALPFREAAAHALSAIHTPATLPYLATLLDDSDANLRVEAIGGIGAFANGLPSHTAAGNASLGNNLLD